MDLHWHRLRGSAGHILLVLTLVAGHAHAGKRAPAVRAEFMRQHPCPSTGRSAGPCPGWQADHWTPLCIGGADVVSNYRWLTVDEHKAKTRSDVRLCRAHP